MLSFDATDFFSMTQQPLTGQGFLVIGGLRSHSDTPHSVGLLWASDQPDHTQHSQGTDIRASGGNRTCNRSKRAAVNPLLNHLTPNVNYSGRTAPLTSKVAFYIFIQQI